MMRLTPDLVAVTATQPLVAETIPVIGMVRALINAPGGVAVRVLRELDTKQEVETAETLAVLTS
jgi:hypothetical protein